MKNRSPKKIRRLAGIVLLFNITSGSSFADPIGSQIDETLINERCSDEIKSAHNEEFQIFLSAKTKGAIKQCIAERIREERYHQRENNYFDSAGNDSEFRENLANIEQSFDTNRSESWRTIDAQLNTETVNDIRENEINNPSEVRPLKGFKNLSGVGE